MNLLMKNNAKLMLNENILKEKLFLFVHDISKFIKLFELSGNEQIHSFLDKDNRNLLHLSCIYSNLDLLKFLLESNKFSQKFIDSLFNLDDFQNNCFDYASFNKNSKFDFINYLNKFKI
jgi:hypothetical protein